MTDTPAEQAPESIPARVLLQLRDGVPNQLHAFNMPTHGTSPADADQPGELVHQVDVRDIIGALAQTQRELILDLREQLTPRGPDACAEAEGWLVELAEWTIAQ